MKSIIYETIRNVLIFISVFSLVIIQQKRGSSFWEIVIGFSIGTFIANIIYYFFKSRVV